METQMKALQYSLLAVQLAALAAYFALLAAGVDGLDVIALSLSVFMGGVLLGLGPKGGDGR